MADSPNVLVLVDDEHQPDVVGFASERRRVRTPTLDWLAETGTVFENAYTPAPVCVPARHSIRTGQLPRTWSQTGFEAFESGYRTFARQFGEHGYMTASAGKMHYPGFAQMQDWRKRLGPTPMKRAIGDDALDMRTDADHGGLSDWKWSAAKEVKRAEGSPTPASRCRTAGRWRAPSSSSNSISRRRTTTAASPTGRSSSRRA